MRLLHIYFAITALIALAGCGPPADIWDTPRVNQIAWSPSDWIAIGTTQPNRIVIAGESGTIKRSFDNADLLFGWDPTGRYLLYAQLARAQLPGAAIEDIARNRLFVYDTTDNSTRTITAEPLPFQRAFWDGDDTVGIIVPTHMAGPFQASEILYGLSGTVLGQYPAPPDIIPNTTVYDRATGRLFCTVTYLNHSGFYSYFYFVQNQHFRPIPDAAGYSRNFAFAPERSIAAIAAVDREEVVHHIDRLDLSQANPSPHPWLSSSELPAGSDLASLSLSPDSSHLAISAAPFDTPYSIYVYNLAAGRSVNIGGGDRPAFSPDGRRIAFVENSSYPHWDGERVFVCNIDGSGKRLIYSMPEAGSATQAIYGWLAALAIAGIVGIALRCAKRQSARSHTQEAQ